MLYWQLMTLQEAQSRWFRRAERWRVRFADLGLESLLGAFGEALRPLGPLAAQVLWVAQPTLGVLGGSLSEEAGTLADLLHDPAALDHLLMHLAEETPGSEHARKS